MTAATDIHDVEACSPYRAFLLGVGSLFAVLVLGIAVPHAVDLFWSERPYAVNALWSLLSTAPLLFSLIYVIHHRTRSRVTLSLLGLFADWCTAIGMLITADILYVVTTFALR